jgi:hypothetical protein
MDSRFSALPHSAQVAVAAAMKALDRAQRALSAKEQIAEQADRRRRAADARVARLRHKMAAER